MANPEFIICYDISDNKRRQKVFKQLAQHALPVQKSVFIFKGSQYLMNQCMEQLMPLLDSQADHILVYAIHQKGLKLKTSPKMAIPGVLYF